MCWAADGHGGCPHVGPAGAHAGGQPRPRNLPCVGPQTTAMVDVFTWGLLVPMLEANPDPVKVEHARQMFYNFFSYNTARPRCLA